jgi:hypothetical protein
VVVVEVGEIEPHQGTLHVSAIVTEPPTGNVGTVAPTPCNAVTNAAPVWIGQVAPPAAVQVAVVQVRLVGAGSVTTALATVPGPAFLTVIE